MAKNNYKKGWRQESARHSLARKGIKTGKASIPKNSQRNVMTPKQRRRWHEDLIIHEVGAEPIDVAGEVFYKIGDGEGFFTKEQVLESRYRWAKANYPQSDIRREDFGLED